MIPRRHIATWFDATEPERQALTAAIKEVRAVVERTYRPDGYNIGMNVGEAAGQTIFHLHVHVIPRYRGDVPEPRGGIRAVIPGKSDYSGQVHEALKEYRFERRRLSAEAAELFSDPPHWQPLVRGGSDPLLPHLRAHLTRAIALDVAVAFVLSRGLELLHEHLKDLLRRGGRLRFLTGDYRDVTDPDALQRLLDLAEIAASSDGSTELRIFESRGISFHPKAYIVHWREGDGVAFVGSSNLSELALSTGIEWNYRVIPGHNRPGFTSIVQAFESLFRHDLTRPLSAGWIAAYRHRRPPQAPFIPEIAPEPIAVPAPHEVQQEALTALAATRTEGNAAGLVVLATGLGKTWLAAFDSNRPEYRRILFVAHREEILDQALATFRRIRPSATFGLYTGQEKAPEADVLFASIQTIGKTRHLVHFAREVFDYIVIDEFHHAAAATYRRLIDHFTSKFILGLTATPERADGGDLLALCGENLVYRCDVVDGIRRGLLVPFRYFGVPDEVDYRNIPWRSTRFDEEALTQAVATRARAQNALDQWRQYAGHRTLAFCCSTRHADFMAAFFAETGVRAVAVHSAASSAPRATSLERLEAGGLDVVFAVDMFNEGVDLPNVDTVMMLRPTESRVVWLQQFGRGLRTAAGKDRLIVVDYIGNHRTFFIKPQTLLSLPQSDAAIARALDRAVAGRLEGLPPGCEVIYDLRAVEILKGLLRPTTHEALTAWYTDFRDRHGVRPLAVEAFHDGYAPRSARRSHGSWLRLVDDMGDLNSPESSLVREAANMGPSPGAFLNELETTPMTRSYKMIVLLAMLNEDRLPGSIDAMSLTRAVVRLAERSARVQADLGVPLTDLDTLRQHLEENPIRAWCGGAGTGGIAYFRYEKGHFAARFNLSAEEREAFQILTRELVEWRLAEYLSRTTADEAQAGDRIVCKVSHAGGRPILFLPDRTTTPFIPDGTTAIIISNEPYEAEFAKVAVNVIHRPDSDRNELPALMRAWFGADAGLPGTTFKVVFDRQDDHWHLSPERQRSSNGDGPELWRQYPREQIPRLFGLEFHSSVWNQGFVFKNDRILLLVTLDKSEQAAEHQYQDRFISPEQFQWQSQNRQHRGGRIEQNIARHSELGIQVHLFVRRTPKTEGRATPFLYCGACDFVSWEGDRPITVLWRLRSPIPERWWQHLGVS